MGSCFNALSIIDDNDELKKEQFASIFQFGIKDQIGDFMVELVSNNNEVNLELRDKDLINGSVIAAGQ